MVSRRVITVLIAGFATLGVAFSLVMAVSALVDALGDAPGAVVLRWVACGCGILLAIDLILLVVVLGLNAIDEAPRHDDQEHS